VSRAFQNITIKLFLLKGILTGIIDNCFPNDSFKTALRIAKFILIELKYAQKRKMRYRQFHRKIGKI